MLNKKEREKKMYINKHNNNNNNNNNYSNNNNRWSNDVSTVSLTRIQNVFELRAGVGSSWEKHK